MKKYLGVGNYIGIGLCMMAWVGLMPFCFQQIGSSLEVGILVDAISTGLLIPIIIYYKLKE
jgi:hypothetical protein